MASTAVGDCQVADVRRPARRIVRSFSSSEPSRRPPPLETRATGTSVRARLPTRNRNVIGLPTIRSPPNRPTWGERADLGSRLMWLLRRPPRICRIHHPVNAAIAVSTRQAPPGSAHPE